ALVPTQDLNGASASLNTDDMQGFIGSCTNLHAGQVASFVGTIQCSGVGYADFSHPLTVSIVDIAFHIVGFFFPNHPINLTQAVTCIPLQRLPSLKSLEIAVDVISGIDLIVSWSFTTLTPRQ